MEALESMHDHTCTEVALEEYIKNGKTGTMSHLARRFSVTPAAIRQARANKRDIRLLVSTHSPDKVIGAYEISQPFLASGR